MNCELKCNSCNDQNCYVNERLCKELNWHDSKAVMYKKLNGLMVGTSIIISCTLPAIASSNYKKLLIFFSTINAILLSLNNTFKFKELYITYRVTANLLTKEKIKFSQKSHPYNNADKDKNISLLIKNTENLIDSQNSGWEKIVRKDKSKNKP